jgi:iron complex outermembrane receptor protein
MRSVAFAVITLGMGHGLPTWAQAVSEGEVVTLPDITITAEHREESLQKTPVAITVVDGETLANQQIRTVREAAAYVPNLVTPTNNQPSTQTFFLRGVGESDPFQESAVAVYADDAILPRPLNSNLYFDDVERIEVLRGPQGTLYGRNSSAGAVRIISRDPDGNQEGAVSVGLGNYNARELRGRINSGLGGDLSGSLSFVHFKRDGTVRNETLHQDTANLDFTAARGKLRYRPNSDLDIQLTLWGSVDKADTTPLIPQNPPDGRPFDPYTTYAGLDAHNEVKTASGSLRVAYQINPVLQFKSITSYATLRQDGVYDNGGQPWLINSSDPTVTKQNYFTQEFQLNGNLERLTYTTGLFYYQEDYIANRDNSIGGASPSYRGQYSDTDTTSIALYGQANFKFTDRLSGTLGLRWTREHKDFDYQVYSLTPFVVGQKYQNHQITGTLVDTGADKSWTSTTPKIGLEYQWSPDISQYVSVAKGFKAGGFDNRASSAITAQIPFEPETVINYETGVKAEFLDKRLRTNLAVFYNDYKDYQASARDAVLGVVIKQNARKASVRGLEFEGFLAATNRLQLRLSFGYMNAKFDEFENATGITNEGKSFVGSVKGNRIPAAPRLTANAGFEYRVPVNIPGVVRINSNISYRSEYYGDYLNTRISQVPSQTLINLATSYLTPDGKWKDTAAVKNLADREFRSSTTYAPSTNRYNHIYGDPRTFLVTAQYNFF